MPSLISGDVGSVLVLRNLNQSIDIRVAEVVVRTGDDTNQAEACVGGGR
jgi:hypothetical protein